MTDCNHANFKEHVEQVKKVAGCEFHFSSRVCTDCGAALWNKDVEQKYIKWASKNREKFVAQFTLPSSYRNQIHNVISHYPNTTESDFVRAALSLYVGYVCANTRLSKDLEEMHGIEAAKVLKQGKKDKMKARLNAGLFETIEFWAGMLGMAPGKFIEEALMRVIIVFLDHNSSSTLGNEIDQRIDMILKAA